MKVSTGFWDNESFLLSAWSPRSSRDNSKHSFIDTQLMLKESKCLPGVVTVEMRVHHTQIRRPRLPAHSSTLCRSCNSLQNKDLGYVIFTKLVHKLSALAIIQTCTTK